MFEKAHNGNDRLRIQFIACADGSMYNYSQI
jgi:hypothetical protein